MATLKPVSATLPDNGVPTKHMIRDIVATFLTKEWPSVDPETLTTSYHISFANDHCTAERPKHTLGISSEPLKVFMKFHKDPAADMDVFKHLIPSKQEEALFCSEYGRSGLGAKVHGFFKTKDGALGRVEEFLDVRNMEPEDVENDIIRADVAKGLAMFHVMETSLEKKAVEPFHEAVIHGLRKYRKIDKLKALGKEGGVNVDNLLDYDFEPRLKRVVDRLESAGSKRG
jgi:choline kinase